MEWMNRAGRTAQPTNQTISPSGANNTQPQTNSGNGGANKSNKGKFLNKDKGFSFHSLSTLVMLASISIIVLSVVALTMLVKNRSESEFVDPSKTQAVFLNGGQVYFGKITSLNDKYLRLNDIYYLQVNQQVQPGDESKTQQQNVSLAKLGCEIHRPQDSMVISKDQVIFWENLKEDDDQRTVPGAIANYKKANPNGQDCNEVAPQGSNDQGQQQPQGEDQESKPENP